METTSKQRLLALDILRGITIAAMILVNNPGSWEYIYAPLQHAQWNGLTPTDLIFPSFMFIMGVATFIALKKFDFRYSPQLLRKITKRSVLIFVVGIGLSWFSVVVKTGDFTNFQEVRILGVMQRLAIVYAVTALVAVFVKHKYIPPLIAVLLVIYAFVLLLGNGYATEGYNILAATDQHFLGLSHMFVEYGLDPEGILSTIPCIAHTLIGFWIGKILLETKENSSRMLQLFSIGTTIMFIGFLMSYTLPLNKKIWSPTYVLVSCGIGALFLSLLIEIIDVKHRKKWTPFFEVFGVNPLFIYVLAGVLATIIEGIPIGNISLKEYLYQSVLTPIIGDVFLSSLVYALAFIAVLWAVGFLLYKKRIYIKL